jgi:tetratricopeptide (TPR) repeat protein
MDLTTRMNLAIIFSKQGNAPKAMDYFSEAVRLKPDYEEAQDNLQKALAKGTK